MLLLKFCWKAFESISVSSFKNLSLQKLSVVLLHFEYGGHLGEEDCWLFGFCPSFQTERLLH